MSLGGLVVWISIGHVKRLKLRGTPVRSWQPSYYSDMIVASSNGLGMVTSSRIGTIKRNQESHKEIKAQRL